jgi:hypothetical protein
MPHAFAKMHHVVALALVGLASAGAAQQPPSPRAPRTWEVPRDHPSIQAAIDSARRGDTVLVAPGRYYENIRFKGKGIVLTSHFARSHDLADIERTIIDGSRPRHPDTASVVMFVNEEDSASVLQGFTITGGRGTVWLDAKDHVEFREGGGILCELSSPIIRFNYIVDNEAIAMREGVVSAGGGGIRCGYAEPTIANNVIRGNRGRYGAGVVLFLSAATVRNNLIVENVGGEDFGGAGLWVVSPLSRRLANVVEYNTIANNRATNGGVTKQRPLNGLGGGVLTTSVMLEFRNNIVWGNSEVSGDQFHAPATAPVTLGRNVVQGGLTAPAKAGGQTLRDDPRFVDQTAFELAPGSPARVTGGQLGAYGGPGAAKLVAPSSSSGAQATPAAGRGVLQRMHAAYDGKWYRTLTFTQRTVITRASGAVDTAIWYESLSGPARLRIDIGAPSLGNGSLYTADSSISVRNGAVVRASAPGNVFLPLIMGAYLQPVDVTERQLRAFKFDLGLSYENTWHGRPAVVVGASAPGDSLSPQFWIDTERLVLVRARGTLFSSQMSDIDVGGYEKVGAAWLATRISFVIGALRQAEEYMDWKANVELSEALFDVAQWKTAPHWVGGKKRP